VSEGKIKVTNPGDDIYDDMVRGYKFRDIRDKAEALYTQVFGARNKWEREVRVARQELNKAISLKVYDRREKAIIAFVLKYASQIPQEENDGI
jgi:hypothetical protein